jgi:hypothetical protein
MALTDAQLSQMSITLLLAVVLFFINCRLRPNISAATLPVLTPYQLNNTKYASAYAALTVAILIALIVDVTKIDHIRYSQLNYWHFVFAIMGLLLAACGRHGKGLQSPVPSGKLPGQDSYA